MKNLRKRVGAIEIVLDAVLTLLHKKDVIRREEIQLEILENAEKEENDE